MKAINPNIYPGGGYYFIDTDGTRFTGQSWAGVVGRVKYYREKQGRSNATTEEEVINQACSRNAGLCQDTNAAVAAQRLHASLKSRVLLWLTQIKEVRDKIFVDDGLRNARTDVCLRCRRHESLPGGCGACTAALKTLTEENVGSRPHDPRLQACGVTGEYMPVSIWLDQQSIVSDELPWECWRKRTL